MALRANRKTRPGHVVKPVKRLIETVRGRCINDLGLAHMYLGTLHAPPTKVVIFAYSVLSTPLKSSLGQILLSRNQACNINEPFDELNTRTNCNSATKSILPKQI